jgi:anti-sigma B factor antagonist
MGFDVSVREMERVVVIVAAGRLTLTEGRTKLRDVVHVSAANGAKRFVLNFTQVEFIDSYGIGELVRSFSVVRQAGGEMKLTGLQGKVKAVLAISRIDRLFDTYPEEAAALEAFGQRV